MFINALALEILFSSPRAQPPNMCVTVQESKEHADTVIDMDDAIQNHDRKVKS